MPQREPLVSIRNFRTDFGRTTVIDDLSFDIQEGETFGFAVDPAL